MPTYSYDIWNDSSVTVKWSQASSWGHTHEFTTSGSSITLPTSLSTTWTASSVGYTGYFPTTTSSVVHNVLWNDSSGYAQYRWSESSYRGEYISSGKRTSRSRRVVLAEIIKNRAFPGIHIKRRRNSTQPVSDQREIRARETLKRVVGDESYRGFLTNGFISVKSRRTQRVYVIYPGHGQTKVFDQGKFIEKLCVILPGDFPPTDSLITRYLMILNDEAHFRSLANKSAYGDYLPAPKISKTRSLVEIASALYQAA